MTISYTVCDADGDGAEEHTDNCKGLANPDQADLDGDGLGNACDADVDGDGAPDSGDNCVTVPNPDQADADRNGVGDACTGDDDGDGRADAVDGCPLAAGATASGCPNVTRSVSIKLVKKHSLLVGSVGAGLAGCRAEAEVTLWKQRRGADRRLVLTTTDDRGRWRTRAPRAAGKYYASVSRTYLTRLVECAPDTSPKVRVRRR
ncbi:thrombospondin type 3 repeat-containing protein [Nocardioides currus]|uniref:thrombospondin type 3 repeat-containing protein n=1 Tax=Nocardioides currus TaxID=2133958 RepID=UPI001FAFCB9C|nr:thrombospondin type 3 repeat-containing protein [Nocardioides currus]